MVTPLERTSRLDLFLESANTVMSESERYEAKVARFERIGIRLFSVANCLVSFGNLSLRFNRSELSMVMQEANLCEAIGFSDEIDVIDDLSRDDRYAKNSFVEGEPFIRFCARHPIFDADEQLVGSIFLIDYQPRILDDESRLLLADLAYMLERELDIGAMRIEQNELRKEIRSLKRDAFLDPVLGMWNRAAITRSLALEMERCEKAIKPLSLLFVGVDQFTRVKEEFGSAVADTLLLKIVSRMRSCIRPFDALGRFELDAFMIVLPGASNLVASAVAERIRLSVLTHQEKIGGNATDIAISIGISSTNVFPDSSSDQMIVLAERALRQSRLDQQGIIQATPENSEITN